MQMQDTTTAGRATDRKALAVLAFERAAADPSGANWQAIAELLRASIPTSRKAKAIEAEPSPFQAWADYPLAKGFKSQQPGELVTVTFADGYSRQVEAVSIPGKPLNIGRTLRIAIAFYRAKIRRELGLSCDTFRAWDDGRAIAVPEFTAVDCGAGGYDLAVCNERTRDLRAGTFDPAAAAHEAFEAPDTLFDWPRSRAGLVRARYEAALCRHLMASDDRPDLVELEMHEMLCDLRCDGVDYAEIQRRVKAKRAPPRSNIVHLAARRLMGGTAHMGYAA